MASPAAAQALGTLTPLREWLAEFAHCVREREIASARLMFCEKVKSFGTWTGHMDGLDDLVERQWRNVWPRTCDFSFDLDAAFGEFTVTAAWIAASWSSYALDENGEAGQKRSGRATFIFRREGPKVLAVHSHFSIAPAGRL